MSLNRGVFCAVLLASLHSATAGCRREGRDSGSGTVQSQTEPDIRPHDQGGGQDSQLPDGGHFQQSIACEGTEGQWSASLRSCVCPGGEVFSAIDGCAAQEANGARIGDADVFVDGHAAADVNPALLASLLRGVAVKGEIGSNPFLGLSSLERIGLDQEIDQVHTLPGRSGLLVHYDLPTLMGQGLTADDSRYACRKLFSQQWPDDDGAGAQLCDGMTAALNALHFDTLAEEVMMGDRESGTGATAVQFSVGNLPSYMANGILRLVGQAGVLYTRTLQFNIRRHWALHIVLSPSGRPMGGRVERRHALNPQAAGLLVEQIVHFDRWFEALSVSEREIGDRAALQDAAQQWLSWHERGTSSERLLTDGRATPIFEPLRAMMIEDAIEPRGIVLAQRMAFEAPLVASFARDGELRVPWSYWSEDSVEAAALLLPEMRFGSQHGTQVASLIAADLPNVKISVMSAAGSAWASRVDLAAASIIDKIENDVPQVVNISRTYEDDVADCERVFGPVFRRFEKQVLFVIAAGNEQMRNPATVCPASLAHRYENAMTVAGVNDNGTLGEPARKGIGGSNYGAEIVHIAAPYCPKTAKYEQDGLVEDRSCGSSFSAPAVANAALRILARRPQMSPKEVAELLMASCDAQGLDVACGGALNIDTLEDRINYVPSHPMTGKEAQHPIERVRHPLGQLLGKGVGLR